VERECIVSHGYGLKSFAQALAQTFERLSVEPITPALHETIEGLTMAIAEHPIEISSGVPETLQYLSRRHHLILVTKGVVAEQSRKVEASGLKKFFAAVEIVQEKDSATYQRVVTEHHLDRQSTWMIGNSPKSDINPALAAGLNAIFLPHGDTWILEHEELAKPQPPRQLLVLERFAELKRYF
jgi:putative hydrolase of the HAD superfamily